MTIELDLKALNHSPASTPAEASVRKSLFALSSTIAHSKRIIVVTGAGISCSSGIPVSFLLANAPPTLQRGLHILFLLITHQSSPRIFDHRMDYTRS
jgi:hypothetical protein